MVALSLFWSLFGSFLWHLLQTSPWNYILFSLLTSSWSFWSIMEFNIWAKLIHSYYAAFVLHCRTAPSCTEIEMLLHCGVAWKFFILTYNEVMLRWLAAESNQYIGTVMWPNVSMNRPLVHYVLLDSNPHTWSANIVTYLYFKGKTKNMKKYGEFSI